MEIKEIIERGIANKNTANTEDSINLDITIKPGDEFERKLIARILAASNLIRLKSMKHFANRCIIGSKFVDVIKKSISFFPCADEEQLDGMDVIGILGGSIKIMSAPSDIQVPDVDNLVTVYHNGADNTDFDIYTFQVDFE